MARFVPDSKTGRWVIIAPTRVTRPHDNPPSPGNDLASEGQAPLCPFCPGNEKLNPIELFRVGGMPGDPNWQIRVITNKFPITDLHEVIIHSPDHDKDIDALPLTQVELILKTYRQRYNFHMAAKNGKVLIFNNHDEHAGASIKHPHSQLVVIPGQIHLEVLPREPEQNVVVKTKYFTVYCPDFSQWPYEIWLAPQCHAGLDPASISIDSGSEAGMTNNTFGAITDDEIKDLASILQKLLGIIISKFKREEKDVPYNYYIHHAQDWYLRIIPRLIHRAGFELGTGLSVNIVDPAKAAEEYKQGLEIRA